MFCTVCSSSLALAGLVIISMAAILPEEYTLAAYRTKRSERWSDVYRKRATTSCDDDAQGSARPGVPPKNRAMWARFVISTKFGKIVREKLRTRAYSCRRALHNIKEPPPPKYWNPAWDTTSLCEICANGVINDPLRCQSCNCIFHRACVTATNNDDEATLLANATALDGSSVFQCAYCVENHAREHKWYLDEVERFEDERLQRFWGAVIVRKARSIFERKNFLAKRRCIVKVQATVRGLLARKKFRKLKRTQMRVYDIAPLSSTVHFKRKMHRHPPLYLSVAVVDPVTSKELFRIDAQFETMGELLRSPLRIPGTRGNVTFIVTLGIVEEQHTIVVVSQGIFSLTNVDNVSEPCRFSIEFGAIQFHPSDHKGVRFILDESGRYALQAQSALEFLYRPCPFSRARCGFLYTVSIETMRRSITKSDEAQVKSAKADRRGRIWVVYDTKTLHFYNAYGEPRARLSVPVADVLAVADLRTTDRSFNIQFQDKKVWNFEADTVIERKAWVHIINSNANPLPVPPTPRPPTSARGDAAYRSESSVAGGSRASGDGSNHFK